MGTFFKAPTGIAFDSTGAMYVTNWSGDSVTKIKASGEHENVYTDISAPAGIAIDADDNICISSYHDNDILKIATNGKSQKFQMATTHQQVLLFLTQENYLLLIDQVEKLLRWI
ncbi:hypothetical protein BGI40_03295 [Snodgrassella communis]|nr:hypothetical protein BGI29_08295 [Snodgrassella communis]PIT26184.1 hypothetical protein BGI38_08560 [Snodgrassella communis]PIT27921.1 hypothetical protein BGI39_07370 [Snodgrassella communis]PIT35140.1 hypothetical protein BGI40_03295 [Snodgrassella communis]